MYRIIEKQKKLTRRIGQNFTDYQAAVLKFDKHGIFDKAAEIAVVKRVAHYMKNIHGYYESDLDYLLQFQNPLLLVSDQYMVNLRSELHEVMARILDTKDHTADYPLMPETKAKAPER